VKAAAFRNNFFSKARCGSALKTLTARGSFTVKIASALTLQQKKEKAVELLDSSIIVAYCMIIIIVLYTFHHVSSPLLPLGCLIWYFLNDELRSFSISVFLRM